MQAFYSTATETPAEGVLGGDAGRWSIEEAFQGSKSHLGFEEPQGWSRQAARRTAPLAMLLYSLTVLWFAPLVSAQGTSLLRRHAHHSALRLFTWRTFCEPT